ncbi:MAG: 1-acyl-sn-glycerol-3-phosphate acyltransferase [Cyanobacteria bacterium J06627_28]
MTFALDRAQPALQFIPPNYSPALRRVMQPLMPAWTAAKTEVADVDARNVETLVNLYREFEAGKTRVLLAFRHPSTTDPYVLSHLLWQAVPQKAREMGLSLGPTHSHFLYDRGIPLWGGRYLGWLFSKLGGVPIQRGKLDIMALKTARQLLLDGRFPLAAAPEGGTNGHNEIVSPLEPGIAQLAFWCAGDLAEQNRDESVVILPIGIQYRYVEEPWTALTAMISQLEADTGLGDPGELDLYGRLYRLAEHLLGVMERYYQDFYGVTFEAVEGGDEPNARLATRLKALMDEALKVAESYFGLRPKGAVIDRCRKLEQAGWDRIFREENMDLPPVELGMANRVAEEANLRMWHMRLVESFVAVTGRYVKERPSAERFAETTLLLHDMAAKLKGDMVAAPSLGKQKAFVTVGEPIRVDDRLGAYKAKRRSAIATLTKDLQTAMESMILSE